MFFVMLHARNLPLIKTDFIKSTDYQPTEHWPLTHGPTDSPTTDPSTNRLKTHQPTDKIPFKDLIIEKKIYRMQTAGKIKTIPQSIWVK